MMGVEFRICWGTLVDGPSLYAILRSIDRGFRIRHPLWVIHLSYLGLFLLLT